MARMAGKARPPQCPVCRAEPGPDCIGKGLAKRQVKRAEQREWERQAVVDIEVADAEYIEHLLTEGTDRE